MKLKYDIGYYVKLRDDLIDGRLYNGIIYHKDSKEKINGILTITYITEKEGMGTLKIWPWNR